MTPRLPDTVEHWPLDRLIPYARNARTHADDQVAQIAASIVEFGWTNPILVDAEGVVVAGHGRLLAARRLGIETVPVVVLGHLTPAQRRAYVIADNKLALNAGWNEDLLAAELHALNGEGFDLALTGFSDAELEALMAPLGDEGDADDGDEDAADDTPAPPRQLVTRAGDLWLIGRHRLGCGSSTDVAVVSRVMEGKLASLVFTSPPYGNQRDYTTGGVGDWDALMRGLFAGLRGIETEHPAVFPVALPEFVMRAYSDDGDVVYEPFAGSGTSLIASERNGRVVKAVELAPEYVDVAIPRWRKLFPDQPVVLADDKRTFEATAAARGVEIADAA